MIMRRDGFDPARHSRSEVREGMTTLDILRLLLHTFADWQTTKPDAETLSGDSRGAIWDITYTVVAAGRGKNPGAGERNAFAELISGPECQTNSTMQAN